MMLARRKDGKIGKFKHRMGNEIAVDETPVAEQAPNLYVSASGLDRVKRDRAREKALEEVASQEAMIEAASREAEIELQKLVSREKNAAMESERVRRVREKNATMKNHFKQSADFSMFNRAPSGTCLPPMNRRTDFDRFQIVPAEAPGRCEDDSGISYVPRDMGMRKEFPTINKVRNLERGILPVDAEVSGSAPSMEIECHPFTVRGFQGSPYVATGIPLDPPWGPYANDPPARMGAWYDFLTDFSSATGEEILKQAPKALVEAEIKKQQQYVAPDAPPVVNQYVLPPNANYMQRQAASMGVPPAVLYGAIGLLGLGLGLVAYKAFKKEK